METYEKRHVLLIYREMIPSIRLCGHSQLENLAERGKLEYRAIQEKKLKAEDLNWANIVLIGRLDNWYEYQLSKRLRNAGKYMIYILDDDLLNIPAEISSAAYYARPDIREYIRGMIEMSDAILSPSPLLLEKYAVDGRRAIHIEEPAINPVKYKPHDLNKPVKIGFAGSIDRTSDLERILREPLIQIKKKYGEHVEFEFFGAIPSFSDALSATCIPYCDLYDEYRRIMNEREWDIGLAPLPDTAFHACKHYNKFCEYAAAGVVGIYSNVQPYNQLKVFPGCNILCINTPVDWMHAIVWLIENPNIREEYRKTAIHCAEELLNVSRSADVLENELAHTEWYGEGRSVHTAYLYQLKYSFLGKQVFEKIKNEGASSLSKAIHRRTYGKMKR